MENNKYHILIVEDDKEIRDGVEIYLKNQGYQVWKAANGKEGLEIVAQEDDAGDGRCDDVNEAAGAESRVPGDHVVRQVRGSGQDHGIKYGSG